MARTEPHRIGAGRLPVNLRSRTFQITRTLQFAERSLQHARSADTSVLLASRT